MYLNLTDKYNPWQAPQKKCIDFEAFTFSGGEPHIKLKNIDLAAKHIKISIRLNSFNDLGLLLLAVDALKRLEIKSFELFIPYFPAARQDRVMIPGEAFSLEVYANLINQLGATRISVYDPHSNVIQDKIKNLHIIDNVNYIQTVLEQLDTDLVLVAPDAGAVKKIHSLAEKLGITHVVECSKKRNVENGKLSGFEVHASDLKQKACLIVDDICDGGRTFLGIAKALKDKNAGPIHLAISHGIFRNGIDELSTHFEKIFTIDSIQSAQAYEEQFDKNILTTIPITINI